jgi:formylglycine-generating enzyme
MIHEPNRLLSALRRLRLISVLAMSLPLFGCLAEPGSFSMTFHWEQQPEGSVWIWVQIEERLDHEKEGPILASAGPVEYNSSTGMAMEMPQVPNGRNRVVVVEIREGSGSALPVQYHGLSEAFSIEPGKISNVDVYLELQKSDAEQQEAEVKLYFHGQERARVGADEIGHATVLTLTSGATTVVVANDASFSANLTTFELASGENIACTIEGDKDRCEITNWDLTAGLPDVGDGQYSAYLKFADRFGYETPVFRVSTVLDSQPPQVLVASLSNPDAGLGTMLYLTVTFHEEIKDNAALEVTPEENAPLFSGPLRNGATTSYTWNSTIDENVLPGDTPFTFSVQATDLLGNSGTAQILLDGDGNTISLSVDTTPPVLVEPSSISPNLVVVNLAAVTQELRFDFSLHEKDPVGLENDGTCTALCPTVLLDNQHIGAVTRNAALDSPGDHLLGFTYTYVIDLADWGEVSKPVPVLISWFDRTGNVMEEELPFVLTFDFVQPQASFCSLSPSTGNGAEIFSYTVTADEPLSSPPVLDVQSANEALFTGSPSTSGDGLSFTWTQPAQGLDSETFTVSAMLTDLADNKSAGPVCSKSALVDGSAPGIGAGEVTTEPVVVTALGTTLLAVGDGATISASFQVADETGLATGSPEVRLGAPGKNFVFEQKSVEAIGNGLWHYVYLLNVTSEEFAGSEGFWPVRVVAHDVAGNLMSNENLGGVPVQVDLTPPTASCILVPDPDLGPYSLDTAPALQVSPLEELEAGHTVEVIEDFSPPLQNDFFTKVEGTKYTFQGQVDGSIGESEFSLRIRLRDLVGNETAADGNACLSGLISGAVDGLTPTVASLSLSAFDADQKIEADVPLRAGLKVIVDLQVSGTTLEPAVTLGSSALDMISGGELDPDTGLTTWQFQRVLDGDEGQGMRPISVTGADTAGNFYSYEEVDAVQLDFTPPFALNANLLLTAPPNSIVDQVTAATNGTTLTLIVTANEVLLTTPTVEASNGNRTIDWGEPTETNEDAATYTWSLILESIGEEEDWQGEYEVTALLTDIAGNKGISPLTMTAPLMVDSIQPPDLDDSHQRGLRLYRNPHGTAETGMAALTEVRGCGLAGDYGSPWDWCPAPGDFTPLETDASLTLYKMTGEGSNGCSSLVVAISVVGDDDGNFAIPLTGDHPGICLSVTDAAGNSSPALQIRNVEWVGSFNSMNSQGYGSNPHKLLAFSSFTPDEWPRLGTDQFTTVDNEVAQGAGEAGDGKTVANNDIPGWRNVSRGTGNPLLSISMMAFDAWRGRALLFGGSPWGGILSNDTYEWNGFGWQKLAPVHAPSARFGGAMAYDAVRGKIVLFGGEAWDGQSQAYSDETWEWDGEDWTQRSPEHIPPAITGHDMAFNPLSGRVMMMGGTSGDQPLTQTWEWTGDDWNLLWQASDGNGFGSTLGLVYDPHRAGMLVYADTNQGTQLLQWTGTDWLNLTVSIGPPASKSWLIFAPDREQALIMQDVMWPAVSETWVLEEDGWEARPELSHPNFTTAVATFSDYAMGEAGLIYGDGFMDVLSGDHWLEQTPDQSPRSMGFTAGSPMTFDPARNQLRLLFSGDYHWDGRFWYKDRGPCEDSELGCPGDFGFGGLLYDLAEETLVQFNHKNTWVYDKSTDQWNCHDGPDPEPAADPEVNRALVSHEASKQLLYMEPSFRQWVWTNMEDQWTFDVPNVAPITGHGAAYDSLRERVVANAHQMGTWFWDGRDWTWPQSNDPANSNSYLPALGGMTYDAARDRAVFHGMDPNSPIGTWEFDGLEWHQAEIQSELPAEGAFMAQYPPDAAAVATGLTGFSAEENVLFKIMQTWTYSPARSRPHLIAAFDLAASSTVIATGADPEPKHLLEIEVTAAAGGLSHTMGTGHFDGQAAAGVELRVFTTNPDPWIPIATLLSATPSKPAGIRSSFDRNWRSDKGLFRAAGSIDRWVAPDGKLYIGATTLEGHGAAATPAEVVLDLLEVRLVYHRGAEAPAEVPMCTLGRRRCDGLSLAECSPLPAPDEGLTTYVVVENCDDGNPCTADKCNPLAGCSNTVPETLCSIGNTTCLGRLLSHCTDVGGGCSAWNNGEACPGNSICVMEENQASCRCIHLDCDNQCCPSPSLKVEYVCFQGDCCAPQCDLDNCGGDDGCGGSCGCDNGLACVAGTCQPAQCSPFNQQACPIGTWCSAADGKCHDEQCDQEMCTVPAGAFWRGCNPLWDTLCASSYSAMFDTPAERPNVWVEVIGFKMDRFEVTVQQFSQCVDAGACDQPFTGSDPDEDYTWDNAGHENHPVNGVSWYGAQDFCSFQGKRLCSEAEWEKAARGADGRVYPWGNDCPASEWGSSCDPMGPAVSEWIETNSSEVGHHPAGRSPYGLHNMGGNVSEWVDDIFYTYYGFSIDSLDNPTGPQPHPDGIEEARSVRGSNVYEWCQGIDQMRTTYRTSQKPTYQNYSIGFRCCQDLP